MIDDLIEEKRDPLPNRHASTWTDFLLGIYQVGLATGNRRYIDAALKGAKVIRDKHLFITGSMSSQEVSRPGNDGWQLQESQQAQETCCAGIWVAFLQNLLHGTGDMAHADCLEQAAFNDLFASQNPEVGDFCYFLNLLGDDKPYDPPPAYGRHCWEGNGLMGIARLPGLIYGKTRNGIAINLYGASEASTEYAGTRLKISQQTDYPSGGVVLIRVAPERAQRFALQFRIPSWCSSAPGVQVNGAATTANGVIDREWNAGDTVRLEFPMGPTILQQVLNGAPRIALRWGPTVPAGTWEDGLPVRKSRDIPAQGARSRADVWPYVPSVLLGGRAGTSIKRSAGQPAAFEAEAVPAAVLSADEADLRTVALAAGPHRIKLRFQPFYSVTRGKYSVWFPTMQKG